MHSERRRALGGSLVAVLASALALPASGAPSNEACSRDNEYLACTGESNALARLRGRGMVRRQGTAWCLKPAQGGEVCLRDHEGGNEHEADTFRYSYSGMLPRTSLHAFVVRRYEAEDVVLVDAVSGRQTRMERFPVVAPDGRSLALAYLDPYDNLPSVIRVYSLRDGRVELAYEHTMEPGEGVGTPQWTAPDALQVPRLVSVEHAYTRQGTVRLKSSEDAWAGMACLPSDYAFEAEAPLHSLCVRR